MKIKSKSENQGSAIKSISLYMPCSIISLWMRIEKVEQNDNKFRSKTIGNRGESDQLVKREMEKKEGKERGI